MRGNIRRRIERVNKYFGDILSADALRDLIVPPSPTPGEINDACDALMLEYKYASLDMGFGGVDVDV